MGLGIFEEVVNAPFLQTQVRVIGRKWMERQFEEAVQRTASCVDGRYAGRSQHHMLLLGIVADVSQEGTLTRPRLSGQEQRLASVLHQVQCILKLLVGGIGYEFHKIPKCLSAFATPSSSTEVVT